ncbi:hypothetical protein CH362_18995 [Leptospira saintgironsiae]|uniref:Uncharacterized protein n=1 Tax=Leptospira saintgironsiae TaxID=2023183 RepID=A0A2M9Y7Q3_9LEPT|nr:hypothetical protein CH362_18995 [Leptospira saintgironsiae]
MKLISNTPNFLFKRLRQDEVFINEITYLSVEEILLKVERAVIDQIDLYGLVATLSIKNKFPEDLYIQFKQFKDAFFLIFLEIAKNSIKPTYYAEEELALDTITSQEELQSANYSDYSVSHEFNNG